MQPYINRLKELDTRLDHLLILQAQSLFDSHLKLPLNLPLSRYELKVWSQHGQDGIIQYLIRKFDITTRSFIEFGASNYRESNTRFLLFHNSWKGLIFDGDAANMTAIASMEESSRRDLTFKQAFITAENINDLITSAGFSGQIGLLSIDIDGNDFWVWKNLTAVQPAIVICEFNYIFGPDRAVTVPYHADFFRTSAHHSNLYFGASLRALIKLADEKGYLFVGHTETGNDAFFVKRSIAANHGVFHHAPVDFSSLRFSESRDESGHLTFLRGDEAFREIAHLPLIDVADILPVRK